MSDLPGLDDWLQDYAEALEANCPACGAPGYQGDGCPACGHYIQTDAEVERDNRDLDAEADEYELD